jgi:hypothetical protein
MLKANLLFNKNYKGEDFDKLNRSLKLMETTINSDQFKTAILNFREFQFTRYKCLLGKKTKTIQLEKLTNQEVFNKLMKGHSQTGNNSFMDLKLQLSYEAGGSAIGETNGDDVTTTYKEAFDRMSEAELAAHLTHEWTHTMEFEHSYSDGCDPGRNCFSVPYAIGNIVEIILTGQCWYNCKYETLNK